MSVRPSLLIFLLCFALGAAALPAAPTTSTKPGKKKLYLIAGKKSHGYGEHAFRAGCILLKKRLDAALGEQLETNIIFDGWPAQPAVLEDADAICVYSDGGTGHPAMKHLDQLSRLAKRGVGVGMMHYAVEVPKEMAGAQFLEWIGGYFEMNWSVNPTWRLRNAELAVGHPITRGVKAYTTQDEWYYHMRFPERMEGVTAILSAVPPHATLSRLDGPHSGNPAVRQAIQRGEKQAIAWARDRPDGGRGFGFTGGHYHWTWADDDNRKLVLNALAWLAKVEVPADGVPSGRPDIEELKLNQDFVVPANLNLEEWVRRTVGEPKERP